MLGSIGAIWVTLKFRPLVGRKASLAAALAMAISPGFVFYGRYAIHEVWLLLFSMLFVLGLLGLWKYGTRGYLWCVAMGTAGMILTKETYIIHIGCAVIAAGVLAVSHKLSPLPDLKRARQDWTWLDLLLVTGGGDFRHRILLLRHLLEYAGAERTLRDFRGLVSDRLERKRPREAMALLARAYPSL